MNGSTNGVVLFASDISLARLLIPSRSAADHSALRSPCLRRRVKQNSPAFGSTLMGAVLVALTAHRGGLRQR